MATFAAVRAMRRNRGLVMAALLLVCACGAGQGAPAKEPRTAPEPSARPASHADLIRVHAPLPGTVVQSPLHVRGEARGTWYFEADFPVALFDGQGRELARSYAQAQGEWMTEAFVPFVSELRFEPPAGAEGVLVLEKANPSGLPEHAAELRIPVRFR